MGMLVLREGPRLTICEDILWNSGAYLQSVLHHLLKDKQIRKHVADLLVKFFLKHDRDDECTAVLYQVLYGTKLMNFVIELGEELQKTRMVLKQILMFNR